MFVYPGFCVPLKTVEWRTLGVTKIQEALEYDAMTVLRKDSCHKCATPFGDILWHTNGNPGSQQDVPYKKIKLSVSQGSCKIIALREGSSDLRTLELPFHNCSVKRLTSFHEAQRLGGNHWRMIFCDSSGFCCCPFCSLCNGQMALSIQVVVVDPPRQGLKEEALFYHSRGSGSSMLETASN